MASRSLWNSYREKIDGVDANGNASVDKSFEYKRKRVGETPEQPGNETVASLLLVQLLNLEVTILLKHLSKFWRSLNLPLINCDIKLHLPSKKTVF